VADTILAGIALTALGAIKRDVPKKLQFEAKTAKSLLSQSWPLIASKAAAVAYLKIDQIMIGNMLDDSDVGIYSVAVDISEVWYILPSALAASAFTGIVTCYVADRAVYRERMQDLMDVMVIAAFGIITLVYLFGTPLILAVSGAEYVDAAAILRIHILACPFIFMGNVLSKSIITEGYLKFSLVRHLLGAALNIALNLYLIPSMGGIGAAWATLISYAAASYFACWLHPKARVVMRQMTRSLLFPLRLVRPF
jgi:PST family polysaccharide transporter